MFDGMSACKNCCNIVYLMETNLSKHRNIIEASILVIGLIVIFEVGPTGNELEIISSLASWMKIILPHV